ncbi:DUF1566 domain-containing protein [Chitiniphilus eburneus]|uniref:DUF1566 domain-containing protein n=1 Tax=Chitiniphilus eburneus TaxID=2571148 RepID=UPI0035CFE105
MHTEAPEYVALQVGDAKLLVPVHSLMQTYLQQALDSTRPGAPPSTAATSRPGPPRIGQTWPEEGGIYAGIMRGADGQPDYHLIVPADPQASIEEIAWGGHGQETAGADSDADGRANTQALVQSDTAHPAAEWAAALRIDGHADFYLPSRRELRLLWVNVPELFEPAWYWSSTQFPAYSAWFQDFVDGYQNYGHKGIEYRARAVRRKVIE